MKRLMAIGAAAAVSAGASAQDAVQWRVELGGNGHWYAPRSFAPLPASRAQQEFAAALQGGTMATIDSPIENAFVLSLLSTIGPGEAFGVWIGLYRATIGSTWHWTDGTPLDWSGWGGSECASGPYPNDEHHAGELGTMIYRQNCGLVWDDTPTSWITDPPGWWVSSTNMRLLIEWSADCNNDGLVDFGQIRSGELSDANTNNIPDCCEATTECPNPLAPVEWRVADGGNGHWYGLRVDPLASLDDFDSGCARIGGHLVSLGSAQEHQFVVDLMIAQDWLASIGWPAIGLRRTSSTSPWRWSTGEPVEYLAWAPGEPSDAGLFAQLWGNGAGPNLTWSSNGNPFVSTGVIEFSADCNADGLVDYGQIRSGELNDANANNIPDCCENGTPCGCAGDTNLDGTGDGIDLATVLTRWAQSAAKFPNADCNRDGVIDGSDLAIVLGSWGACP